MAPKVMEKLKELLELIPEGQIKKSIRNVPYFSIYKYDINVCWFHKSRVYRVFIHKTDERIDVKTAEEVFKIVETKRMETVK